MKAISSRLAVVTAGVLAATAVSARADVITDWNLYSIAATKNTNSVTNAIAASGVFNSNLASRIHAIESIAVYNALNSVTNFGTFYGGYSNSVANASPEAAIAKAAHDVLYNYATNANIRASLDTQLAASLAAITNANGIQIANGTNAGATAAAAIIAARASDGSSPNTTYAGPASITPGVYQLTPNIPTVTNPPFTFANGINSQWGNVTPFLLASGSQFRPVAPPALNSAAYKSALNEVKLIGNPSSSRHTAEQTHIANFYRQDAEVLDNEIARTLATSHNLTLPEEALLFLTLDAGIADTRIAEWDAKYYYLNWRPITALNADNSGNVTNNYTAWRPTIVTPNHPSYPSGHSGTVVAIEILRAYFGDFNTLTIHTTTGESPRTVTSLNQIEVDNGLSRIYGGIHFSFDNAAGQKLGSDVAAWALAHAPQPLP